jgi:hypothetical protein
MTSEYEKARRQRDPRPRKEPEEKWKHERAEPYVRRPLNKKELLEQLEEDDANL